ncbi:MAG: DUF4956 domain-containing protein [Firmicutes bacterium]|nr:DUF4956 domain-containing protein [Bacillota bacterium]
MTNIFASIFSSGTLTIGGFAISLVVALILGAVIAIVYSYHTEHSNGFLITVSLLPAIVAVIIMMVNGSIGASVAVAGTFSLVRFRSAAGTAREICAVFLAMAVGLACGMGYVAFAAVFAIVLAIVTTAYDRLGFLEVRDGGLEKVLKVTVPEDLDYEGMFDDLFAKYTSKSKLTSIKTSNLGSLNKLHYNVTMKKAGTDKSFIDELRCRNGNLEISLALLADSGEL